MGAETEINWLGSARGAVAVDLPTTDFTATGLHSIHVSASGDVKVDLPDGSTVTFVSLAAGVEHAIAVTKIYKTGMIATSILALK